MIKLTLNVADLRVASFDTGDRREAFNAVTGTGCWTRPTFFESCTQP